MKLAFWAAFSKRRCLGPADGFCEWQREGADGKLMAFAGLWGRCGFLRVRRFAASVASASRHLPQPHAAPRHAVPPCYERPTRASRRRGKELGRERGGGRMSGGGHRRCSLTPA